MTVLGIDTSCDDTSAACIRDHKVLSNIVLSQELHSEYGGIIPELAARDHIKSITGVANRAVENIGFDNLNGIGVTYGPGLIGSLVVGVSFAKALSYGLGIPFYGVNHTEAHIFSLFTTEESVVDKLCSGPFMALIVSGGHTDLVLVREKGDYTHIGATLDDAAGEAFDKVARMLGLQYPGGPAIEELARSGDPKAINFPRPKVKGHDFSFSGLKTSVMYHLKNRDKTGAGDNTETKEESQRSTVHSPQTGTRSETADIAASFQEAVVDSLVTKLTEAARKFDVPRVGVVGGVAANMRLRHKLEETGIEAHFPDPEFCTDNGAMVALCAEFFLDKNEVSLYGLGSNPRLKLSGK
jgi:N6-L-threonylcarbamoyladenine synthase